MDVDIGCLKKEERGVVTGKFDVVECLRWLVGGRREVDDGAGQCVCAYSC